MNNFKRFDPDQVARYEADLWKDYYERKPLQLFRRMVLLLKQQFTLSPLQALYAGYLMTRSQFIFARDRAHYKQARYYLYRFFRVVMPEASQEEVYRVTTAEFGWWLIHRELFDEDDKTKLVQSFQHLYRVMYGLNDEQSYRPALLRTQATVISDRWIQDRDTAIYYPQILAALQQGYRALRLAIDEK